jgi:hypothetical protein
MKSINEEERISLVLRAVGIQQGWNIALYQLPARRPSRRDRAPRRPQQHVHDETVHRKELRPVISTGAEVMVSIFGVG